MDFLSLAIVLVVLLWASFHALPRRGRKLPPGPYALPIIGNILKLGQNPHQSLANLSKTYGPLMSLQLGAVLTVVVSSPEVAKQVLQQHDEALSSRKVMAAAEAHDFHNNSITLLPVASPKWKKGRKIFREYLFSTLRLDESQSLRSEKLMKLRDYVAECADGGRAVNVGEAAFITTLNLMAATIFSVDVTNFGSDVTQGFKEIVEGWMRFLGAPNIADFFPFLKPVDPQGIKRQAGYCIGKLLHVFEDMIRQRLQSVDSSEKYDLLETLLCLREESGYMNTHDMKYLFMDLLLGGTHTVTSMVEWAMTELVLNPAKMANVKNELTTVIGKSKQVQESDISRLPYLQSVIKETFRLHPVVPLLIPRKADYEVKINGYTIPKNAQIFVNVWAMGRDPSIWSNPTSFEPERFLNRKMDYKGQDFTLIPFGSGRRICPGISLADRMLPLMLASLIHEFDWKLEAGVNPEDVDTTDKFGVALHKAVPLMAIPIKM